MLTTRLLSRNRLSFQRSAAACCLLCSPRSLKVNRSCTYQAEPPLASHRETAPAFLPHKAPGVSRLVLAVGGAEEGASMGGVKERLRGFLSTQTRHPDAVYIVVPSRPVVRILVEVMIRGVKGYNGS
jgi:hypothetical protein